MKRFALTAALALATLGATASPASATPLLGLDIHHYSTNFAPGSPAKLTARTLQEGSATSSEEQQVTVAATSGAFRLTFEGQTTTDLAFDSTALQVRTALRDLSTINGKNVLVKDGNFYFGPDFIVKPYVIDFNNSLANTDVSQVSVSAGSPAPKLRSTYRFDVSNLGDVDTSGPITLTVQLPAGVGFDQLISGATPNEPDLGWSCPGASAGDSTLTCVTTTGRLARHNLNRNLTIGVLVDPGASGEETTSATISGGGAPSAVSATESTPISAADAPFGVFAPSFTPDSFDVQPDGVAPLRQAGAHPDLLVVPFDYNTATTEQGFSAPAGNIRDVAVDLPPGFLGNPTAVGECDLASFTVGACPSSAQVGRIDANLSGYFQKLTVGVFNLTHPRGAVTDLGFVVGGNPVHVKVHLDPANGYAITSDTDSINETFPPFDNQVTIWGVPSDHSHDSERCASFKLTTATELGLKDTSALCATDHPAEPFLTVPSSCSQDNVFRANHYDSWQDTGNFGPEIDYTAPVHLGGCQRPRFDPTVSLNPTGTEAASPTGLDVTVHVPQNDNSDALATPPVKSTVVTFPKGMTFNPAFADGLNGCSEAQFGISGDGTPNGDPVACPDNSRIGTVSLTTPLLPDPVVGSMYLAKQNQNPYNTTFALYMAVHDTEDRGILVKIPARIEVDPNSGQIVSSFDELPQFPFTDFTLSFRSGQRAPLMNPPSCGTQTIGVQIASYAQPDKPVDASNSYQLNQGPGGSACPASLSDRPFDPQMDAGVTDPHAGAYSPFVFRLTRTDAEQDISKVTVDPPLGLVAKLAGVDTCSEAQIATIPTGEGSAQSELDNPHCPSNSLIGGLHAGVGAGTSPNYFNGRLYLAGPYQGAPLSFALGDPGDRRPL